MNITIAAILIAIAIGVAVMIVRMISRKRPPAEMPVTAEGIERVGWDHEGMTRSQAQTTALNLAEIRKAVVAECRKVYRRPGDAYINLLVLDVGYHKAAEWTGIAAGTLYVNPMRQKHRSHFAEEIHNKFRHECFGEPHIYAPLDVTDHTRRERVQEFCRKF